MITKNDCLLLLMDLENNGIDTEEITNKLIQQINPSLEVIKFINDRRPLELTNFFNKIRKSYNQKKSNLYINIVKEITNPQEVLTTLNAYSLQILLYSKNIEDKEMFFKHARLEEVYQVLYNYTKTLDLTNCNRLMKLIKTDIKALESLKDN